MLPRHEFFQLTLAETRRAPDAVTRSTVPVCTRTSFATAVEESDTLSAAVRIGAQTYEPLPPFLVALAIYMPIVYAIVSVQRLMERRLARAEAAA